MEKEIFEELILREGLIGEHNHLKLFRNIRFSMYPARAFALVLQKIYDDTKLDFVEELGKTMGESGAKKMQQELSKIAGFIDKEYQKTPNLIEIMGFGKIHNYQKKENETLIIVKDHPVIEQSKKKFGDNSIACVFYGEVYASFVRILDEINITNIEHIKCAAKGAKYCEWRLKNVN